MGRKSRREIEKQIDRLGAEHTEPNPDRAEGELSPLADRLRELDDIYREHVDGNARLETQHAAFYHSINLGETDAAPPPAPTPEAERILAELKDKQPPKLLRAYGELYIPDDAGGGDT
jgi:sugar phosphate isomerase/epimerase